MSRKYKFHNPEGIYFVSFATVYWDRNNNPGKLIKELKTFTSEKLQELIIENPQESRKEWLLWMMERAGSNNSNVK